MDQEKRLYIARELIYAASHNIQRNLRYYKNRGIDLENKISTIEALMKKIEYMNSIEALMGIEGNIRKNYYRSWKKIIKQKIDFDKRVRRPPDNMINSMISYLNSLFYTRVLSEIYKTQLDPTISYLHEPGVKRFSLALDLSEVFKPLIVDRLIFSLLNRKQIVEGDFERESNYLYLKDRARKEIIVEYDKALARTIKHKELGREVSYSYLIRLECYKLIKHLIGEKEYESFKMWW